MTNQKVSSLTAAVVSLAGTEVLPIVQAGFISSKYGLKITAEDAFKLIRSH